MENRKKLFILDDDLEALWILREVFSATKLEVKTSSESENLLHDIVAFAPDVLLIDVNLDHYDGRTLCHHLRHTAATKNIPIIMMSKNDLSPMDGVFCKADLMIKKPFNFNDLLNHIEDLVSKRSDPNVN